MGFEPISPSGQRILNPPRTPIPPRSRKSSSLPVILSTVNLQVHRPNIPANRSRQVGTLSILLEFDVWRR